MKKLLKQVRGQKQVREWKQVKDGAKVHYMLNKN